MLYRRWKISQHILILGSKSIDLPFLAGLPSICTKFPYISLNDGNTASNNQKLKTKKALHKTNRWKNGLAGWITDLKSYRPEPCNPPPPRNPSPRINLNDWLFRIWGLGFITPEKNHLKGNKLGGDNHLTSHLTQYKLESLQRQTRTEAFACSRISHYQGIYGPLTKANGWKVSSVYFFFELAR